MAEDSDQEKTEEPTGRRLEQAREKGQIARSKELNTVVVLLATGIGLLSFGELLATGLMRSMARMFSLGRDEALDANKLLGSIPDIIDQLALPLVGLLVMLFVATLAGSFFMGGFNMSAKAAMPKWSKMNPLSGLKRIFGTDGLVELAKSIAKVLIIALASYALLVLQFEEIMSLNTESFPGNLVHAVKMLLWMFILLCSALLIVVAIDVPYQKWNHIKQLRMTKQEVKDEMKDTEGKPEVKRRIRQLQFEMTQRRMMAEVPKADVVITNPSHYSVALKYDAAGAGIPTVIAKGHDEVAMKIREIAREHQIPLIAAPPLCRAIFYNTELDDPIPDGLFVAVAQVLAYVFQLKQYKTGRGTRPKPLPNELPIPDELKHN